MVKDCLPSTHPTAIEHNCVFNIFPAAIQIWDYLLYSQLSSCGENGLSVEYNTKMDVKGVGHGSMDSINVARDKVVWRTFVKTLMNLHIPQKMGIS
jgi:hypothetical protein